GRKNKMGNPAQMLLWQKEHAIQINAANKIRETKSPDEAAKLLTGKFLVGKFVEELRPEYTQQYQNFCISIKK
ncbi:MAG: hypothetical protein SCK28_12295, partial [Bacillota bacterium]|nr:hypothetical protein [Bacillota bacterium]